MGLEGAILLTPIYIDQFGFVSSLLYDEQEGSGAGESRVVDPLVLDPKRAPNFECIFCS